MGAEALSGAGGARPRRTGAGRTKSGKPRPGTGGQGKRKLEGKGPTPPAAMRPGHPAQRRAGKPASADGSRSRRPGDGPGRSAASYPSPGTYPAAGRDGRASRGAGDAAEFVAGRNSVVESLRAGVPSAVLYIGARVQHDERIRRPAVKFVFGYSDKRLVPGYEAPVLLAYSARNRSASCRIPYTSNPKAKRVEVRFPDPMANPYLGFAAMLMAGLDGIKNKLDPGPAMDKDLYDLPKEELKAIPTVCGSLREALENLDKDRGLPEERRRVRR